MLHTDTEEIDLWGALGEVEAKLPQPPFFRLSSNCIVNLAYIKGIKGYDVDIGGAVLRVARPKKKELLAALAEYLGR